MATNFNKTIHSFVAFCLIANTAFPLPAFGEANVEAAPDSHEIGREKGENGKTNTRVEFGWDEGGPSDRGGGRGGGGGELGGGDGGGDRPNSYGGMRDSDRGLGGAGRDSGGGGGGGGAREYGAADDLPAGATEKEIIIYWEKRGKDVNANDGNVQDRYRRWIDGKVKSEREEYRKAIKEIQDPIINGINEISNDPVVENMRKSLGELQDRSHQLPQASLNFASLGENFGEKLQKSVDQILATSNPELVASMVRAGLMGEQGSGDGSGSGGVAAGLDNADGTDYSLQSPAGEFRSELEQVKNALDSANPEFATGRFAKRAGQEAAHLADQSFVAGDSEDAAGYMGIAETFLDIALGVNLVTAGPKDVYEAITGYSFVTGEKLDNFSRGFAVFGALTLGFGSKVGTAIKVGERLVNVAKASQVGTRALEGLMHAAAAGLEVGARTKEQFKHAVDFTFRTFGNEIGAVGDFYRKMHLRAPWFRELYDPKFLEKVSGWGDNAVEHIYVGETMFDRTTKLAGGMHTVDGWNSFSKTTGARGIMEVQEGGAILLRIENTPELFTARGYRNAQGAGRALGYAEPIKTLFPRDWSRHEIVDAINSVGKTGRIVDSPGSNGFFKIGSFNGVKVKVVFFNGKIHTAFPVRN